MSLSELVVPVLLCFTACYALGKRVDVYTALTRGAEEGLNVLVHILPSLIALLTAVYMFRASGAMEYLGALLAPALERVGIPPEVAPLLFIRPISGSGALAVGSELMATYANVPSQLIDIIQGVIFLFFAAEQFLSGYRQKLVVKTAQEELAAKAALEAQKGGAEHA